MREGLLALGTAAGAGRVHGAREQAACTGLEHRDRQGVAFGDQVVGRGAGILGQSRKRGRRVSCDLLGDAIVQVDEGVERFSRLGPVLNGVEGRAVVQTIGARARQQRRTEAARILNSRNIPSVVRGKARAGRYSIYRTRNTIAALWHSNRGESKAGKSMQTTL